MGLETETQEGTGDGSRDSRGSGGIRRIRLGETSSPTPCICLLSGMDDKELASEEGDGGEGKTSGVDVRNIFITRLPATLGRSHDNQDPAFFGVGPAKAISREHLRIHYRDSYGGSVEYDPSVDRLVYRAKGNGEGKGEGKLWDSSSLIPTSTLLKKGCFIVECLGKNRIIVDQQRVEQGKAAVLKAGSAIRVSNFCFYFLLPNDATPEEVKVEILPSSTHPQKDLTEASQKRKLSSIISSSSPSLPSPSQSSSSPKAAETTSNATAGLTKKAKQAKEYQDELESLSTEDLLEQMTAAIQNKIWGRRQSLVGAAIAAHAVKDAARDPEIQKTAATEGGITRAILMQWIENSPTYSEWKEQMHTKMEAKSYQVSITKSLLKTGFSRTGTGRYVKWQLPEDIVKSTKSISDTEKSEKKEDEMSERENEEADQDQEEEEGDDDDDDESKTSEQAQTSKINNEKVEASKLGSTKDDSSEEEDDDNSQRKQLQSTREVLPDENATSNNEQEEEIQEEEGENDGDSNDDMDENDVVNDTNTSDKNDNDVGYGPNDSRDGLEDDMDDGEDDKTLEKTGGSNFIDMDV